MCSSFSCRWTPHRPKSVASLRLAIDVHEMYKLQNSPMPKAIHHHLISTRAR